MKPAPHLIPYQGSKRRLAKDILSFVNFNVDTLYEPFAGSAAITLAMAVNDMANKFVISDKLKPLAELWQMIIDEPERLSQEYSEYWDEQLDDPAAYFKLMRGRYSKTRSPSMLLYLIARCVKNAVRFNNNGDFNQSPDNRRLGMRPSKVVAESKKISYLLKGRAVVQSYDFQDSIATATKDDLVYMDPPWQGTSGKKDSRYAYLLNLEVLIEQLNLLNEKEVPFLLSFDGACGDKIYGNELPKSLNLKKVSLNAGRSSQATLLGRSDITIESLYLSPAFIKKSNSNVRADSLDDWKQEELLEIS